MQVRNYRPLNVVCLLSGGKDSVYHLHRIHSLGHNIVALATLTPTPPPLTLQSSVNSNEREGVVAPIELDSWIYQSVGTEMISGVAHALNRWPLYVLHLPLSTHAQRTTLYYEETSEDEVEYLVTLLTRIKTDFPTLDAVASGAILSHYQRLRIEHVCSRLGLLSLAYLWEQDQITLLEEMLREGISAVVIKTACVGLDKQHVGCTLNELHSHLLCLHQRYGMNVCGEGGEYETLTLDAPLYQARIVLDETSVIQHAPDVHLLRIHRFHLEVKPPLSTLPPPPPIIHVLPSEVRSPPSSLKQLTLSLSTPLPPPLPLRECNGLFHLSITAPSDIDNIDQATLYLFTHLQNSLKCGQCTMFNLFFVFVVLTEMKDFEAFNRVYKTFFGVNPPSRACVAVRMMTSRVRVEVWGVRPQREVITTMTTDEWSVIRRGLHVQSLSNWAPACIGPYSQSQGIDLPHDAGRLWWLAGQIGLHSPTLTLLTPHDPVAQVHLIRQHITRVLDSSTQHRLQSTSFAHGILYFVPSLTSLSQLCEALPPDWRIRLICVAVSELPRNAAVEIQMLAHEKTILESESGIKLVTFSDTLLIEENAFSTVLRITYFSNVFTIATLVCSCSSPPHNVEFDCLVLKALMYLAERLCSVHAIENITDIPKLWSQCLNVRLWYHPSLVTTENEIVQAIHRVQLQEPCLPPLVAYPSPRTHLFLDHTSNRSPDSSMATSYVTLCCEMFRYHPS